MNKARRIGIAIAAPALSISVVAGGVAAVASPAQAASTKQTSKTKQVAITANGSKLSASQIKSVVGISQKAIPAQRFSQDGFKGYTTAYEFDNDYLTTNQMAATVVARAKTDKALPKSLKKKQAGFHVTSYKYNKKTKAGYQTGWLSKSQTETDENGNKVRVNIYAASTVRGKGKTAVQAVIWQITFGKEKANTKVLVQESGKAAKILAKRYKI